MRLSASRRRACRPIQPGQRVQAVAAGGAIDARRVRQVEHRVALRAQLDALVGAGQKAAAPQRLAAVGLPLARQQHDERRQILVGAAQAVRQPGAHAGPPGLRVAGAQEQLGRAVVDLRRGHGVQERHLVHHARQVRQQIRQPGARSPVARERERRAQQARRALDEGEALALGEAGGQRLAVAGLQLRLGGEQIQLRRAAGHGQADDLPGARPRAGPAAGDPAAPAPARPCPPRCGPAARGGRVARAVVTGGRAPSTAAGAGHSWASERTRRMGRSQGSGCRGGDRLVRHAGGRQPGAVAVEAVPAHGQRARVPAPAAGGPTCRAGARLGAGRGRADQATFASSSSARPARRRLRRAAPSRAAGRWPGSGRGRQQQPAPATPPAAATAAARTGPTTAPGCRTPSPATAPPRPAAAPGSGRPSARRAAISDQTRPAEPPLNSGPKPPRRRSASGSAAAPGGRR